MIENFPSIKKTLFTVISIFFLSLPLFAQVDNISAGNPVYNFLRRMSVSGNLKNYDDVILPISRGRIIKYLSALDTCENLSQTDRNLLLRFKAKIDLPSDGKSIVNIFDGFPDSFPENLIIDRQKHLYFYHDTTMNFFIDPVLESENIYASRENKLSPIINFGGIAGGSYDNWLGFYFKGTNGIVYGSRQAALNDKRIAQSFTFNETKLNYFDGTSGYLRVRKGIVNLELGRERILWGNGYIDRTVLSDNPQLFDFVRFGISYKNFRYDFIHGWLVQKPDTAYHDSLAGFIRYKPSKYIAVSRLGYRASSKLSFGISQMIIYANRPFEAAYLNPFLFWESAQRSMNDLDNSFLTFDGRYLITSGFEISSSVIFDDINFSYLFHKKGWERSNNGTEWQSGVMLTAPMLPDDFTLKLELTQARPYIFSHPGAGESLTYTNNGYLLGADMQPNSSRISAEADYRLSSRIFIKMNYSHTVHGANIYDGNGNLLKNVGGNVFQNISIYDSEFSPFLDGNRELTDDFCFNINYESAFGYYFNFNYRFMRQKINNIAANDGVLTLSFYISFE